MSSRIFLVNKLDKKNILQLLEKIPIESLKELINISNKDSLIKLIIASYSRNELKDLIYRTELSNLDLSTVLYKNELKKANSGTPIPN
jgi:hypothetical protein